MQTLLLEIQIIFFAVYEFDYGAGWTRFALRIFINTGLGGYFCS